MTFRGRLTVAAAVAVAIAILLASGVIFLVVRHELRGGVDASLEQLADSAIVRMRLGEVRVTLPPSAFGGATGYAQVVGPNGAIRFGGGQPIPPSEAARRVAARAQDAVLEDTTVDGIHLRVYTTPLPQGVALQVARPLTEIDDALRRLAAILGAVGVVGVALAAAPRVRRVAHRRPADHDAHRGDRARDPNRRPLAADRGHRRRRGRPPRGQLQSDARGARDARRRRSAASWPTPPTSSGRR